MDNYGNYELLTFPNYRNPTLDTLELGKKKHHIPLLLEVDITDARMLLHQYKKISGEGLSFTSWVMKCIGHAVSEHKHVHAMRKGRKSLVLFDDVDVSIIVERFVGEMRNSAESLPMPYIVRKVNEKTVRDIHDEIRKAQKESLASGEVQLGTRRKAFLTRIFCAMPRFLRTLIVWRRLLHDPFFAKANMGTIAITSVGSKSSSKGYGWAIPIGIHPLIIALGNIVKKPGITEDEITIREFLSMTVLFDHDVTDGVPAAHFVQRLSELLEQGFGLDE